MSARGQWLSTDAKRIQTPRYSSTFFSRHISVNALFQRLDSVTFSVCAKNRTLNARRGPGTRNLFPGDARQNYPTQSSIVIRHHHTQKPKHTNRSTRFCTHTHTHARKRPNKPAFEEPCFDPRSLQGILHPSFVKFKICDGKGSMEVC